MAHTQWSRQASKTGWYPHHPIYIDILRICVIIAHVMELKLFRWIILQEQEEFRRFHENVESVACSCGPAQRERDIVDILKN